MEWMMEGSDGIERLIDPDKWDLKLSSSVERFAPSEATISMPRAAPVKVHDWIRAVDGGKTEFLGYVSRQPSIPAGGKKTISALGVEALLMNCPCPLQSYWAESVYLSQVFGHADPDTSVNAYDIPGLIFAANSLIPPGVREDTLPAETTDDWISHGPAEIVDYDNAIVKYPNMGTRSRIGTSSIFVNGYPYSDKASYVLMAAGNVAVWRDADDLYLRHWLSSAPIPGWIDAPVYAKNAFDTRCRFGGIDTDSALDVQLIVDQQITIGDVFFNLARSFGQYLRFIYSGKLCYLYVVDDFEDMPVISISSDECEAIKYIQAKQIEPDAVTGAGHGGSKTRQMQSIFKTMPGGAYIRQSTDCPFTFFNKNQALTQYNGSFPTFTPTVHHGMLFERTLADWNESRGTDIIELIPPAGKVPAIGAGVEFTDYNKTVNLKVFSVEKSNDDRTKVIIGGEVKTINDAIQAQKDIAAVYATVKNDFGVVAELITTDKMVDFTYYEDAQSITYTHYITTWSYWLNVSAWGRPGLNVPPIVSYGYEYYRDHNVRLLLSLKCRCHNGVTGPFTRGKCRIYIYCKYTDTASVTFIHPLSYLKFDPLDEEIVDWDITPYLPYGSSTNKFSINVVLYSTDLIYCYKEYSEYPKYNYSSPLFATMTLKLVELGHSAKRLQMRASKKRCGPLTYI